MDIPDLINSLFESASGIFLWNNVRILLKHREVKGVSVLTVIVFSFWGYWNLFYYPHLSQTLSFFGGLLVVSANTTWIILAIYYKRKSKEKEITKRLMKRKFKK